MDPHRPFRPLFVPLLALLLVASACSSDDGDQNAPRASADPLQHELSVDRAAELLADEPGVIVLDVRAPDEFAAGHIPRARNVAYPSAGFAAEVARLDRAAKYLIYCGTGRLSAGAFAQMHDLGFAEIYHLEGGFRAWQDAGRPVEE